MFIVTEYAALKEAAKLEANLCYVKLHIHEYKWKQQF